MFNDDPVNLQTWEIDTIEEIDLIEYYLFKKNLTEQDEVTVTTLVARWIVVIFTTPTTSACASPGE